MPRTINHPRMGDWPRIVRAYWNYYAAYSSISPAYLADNCGAVRKFLRSMNPKKFSADRIALSFTREDAQKWVDSLSPGSRRNYAKGLRHFSRWLWLSGQRPTDQLEGFFVSRAPSGGGKVVPVVEQPFSTVLSTAENVLNASHEEIGRMVERDFVLSRGSRSYGQRLYRCTKMFLEWLDDIAQVPLAEITAVNIAAYVSYLENRPVRNRQGVLHPNTVLVQWKAVRKLCKWLVQLKVLKTNPTDNLKGPKGVTVYEEPLPIEVYHSVMREAGSIGSNELIRARNEFIVLFYAQTGARLQELVKLQRKDVEHVSSVVITGKGAKQRKIGLTRAVCDARDKYLALRTDKSQSLIVDAFGRPAPAPQNVVNKLFQVLSERVGWQVSCHDMRRTYFTELARRGTPWFVLKALGGWASTAAAERYIHAAAAERSVLIAQTYDPFAGVDAAD